MLQQVAIMDAEGVHVPPRTTREEAVHLAATAAVTRWIRSPLSYYLSADDDSADASEDNDDTSDDDDGDLTQVRVGDALE